MPSPGSGGTFEPTLGPGDAGALIVTDLVFGRDTA